MSRDIIYEIDRVAGRVVGDLERPSRHRLTLILGLGIVIGLLLGGNTLQSLLGIAVAGFLLYGKYIILDQPDSVNNEEDEHRHSSV